MSAAPPSAGIPAPAAIPDEVVDRHLEAILRASGSSLRYYTLPKSLSEMRMATRQAMMAGCAASMLPSDSDTASAVILAVMQERGFPTSQKPAAHAGWEACVRHHAPSIADGNRQG